MSLLIGSIRLGWATELSDAKFEGFILNTFSISFDAYEKTIYAQGRKHQYPNLPPVNPNDVVGCLLDTSEGASSLQFNFYLNGVNVQHIRWKVERPLQGEGSSQLYYPTASLSGCQQVYFNFGQIPYRYSMMLSSNQLISFANSSPKVNVNRMFEDEIQIKFERWMLHFNWRIAESASDNVFEELKKDLFTIIHSQQDGFLRLAQTIIEELSTIDNNQVQ